MVKRNVLLVFLVAGILLIKCTIDKKGNNTNNNIDVVHSGEISFLLSSPETESDTLKTSYFADTVIYIPLETTADNYIRRFKQLWMNDSVLLVNSGDALFMFQRNGEFIRKVGRNGKGPGEYARIFNFEIIRDTIYISSTAKKSFIKYTLNGTFCDEIQLNYQPVFFSSTIDNKLVCYHWQEGKLFLYDKNFLSPDTIVVEHGVTVGRYKYSISDPAFMTYFQKHSSGLLFNNYLNDTIWKIAKAIKEPGFILDIKNDLLPLEKSIEFCNGDFKRWESMAKTYQLVHIIPIESQIFAFQKYWLGESYTAIYYYNRKQSIEKKFNSSYIYDDLVSKQKISNVIFLKSANGYLVAEMQPYKLRQNIEGSKEKPSSLWLKQMASVGENDNPILILMRLHNKN